MHPHRQDSCSPGPCSQGQSFLALKQANYPCALRVTSSHPQGHAHGPRPRPCAVAECPGPASLPPKLPGPARPPGFLPGLPIWIRSLCRCRDREHPLRSSASSDAPVLSSLTPLPWFSHPRLRTHPGESHSQEPLGQPVRCCAPVTRPALVPMSSWLGPELLPPRPPGRCWKLGLGSPSSAVVIIFFSSSFPCGLS